MARENAATVYCEEICQQEIVFNAVAVLYLPLLQSIDTS